MDSNSATIERIKNLLRQTLYSFEIRYLFWGLAIAFLVVLYYIGSRFNYLFFHSIGELWSIIVAAGIFIVAWNSRRFLDNHYFLFLGIAYFSVAAIDLLHLLAFKGMGVFSGESANPATQLWLAARYLEAISLLAAPLFITRKKISPQTTFAIYGAATAALLFSVYYGWFPDAFIEGSGLTWFKITSEYIIVSILAGSAYLLYLYRANIDRLAYRLLLASILLTVASEVSFTLYADPHGLMNTVGHILKIASFYLIYRAILKTGLNEPYRILFRNLKTSENRIKAEKEKYHIVADFAYDWETWVRPDGRYEYVSPSMERITGYKNDDLVADPGLMERIVHPDDLEKWRRHTHFSPEGPNPQGQPNELEFRIITKRGKTRWVQHACVKVRGSKGEFLGFRGSNRDITRLKSLEGIEKAKEEIRKLSEFTQRILDNTPASIITLDKEGKVTSANQYSKKLSKSNTLLNKNIFNTAFFKRNGLSGQYKELLSAGRPFKQEDCRTFDLNGDDLYLNIMAAPLSDKDGNIEGALSIALDNTEAVKAKKKQERLNRELRKKAAEHYKDAEEIRRLSEFNQRILDVSPASIVVLDKEGVIISANARASQLMGGADNPVVGQSLLERKEIRANQDLVGQYEALLEYGIPFFFDELSYVSNNKNKRKYLNIIAVPLLDRKNRVEGAISMALDNTEAVKAKQKLEYLNRNLESKVLERTKELDQINKRLSEVLDLKSKFIADASHELRTPLTVIQGNLELAAREAEMLSGEIPEVHKTIIDEVNRMTNILTDLTMLTNMDSHNEQFQYEKVNIGQMVRSVGMSLKILAEKKNIKLDYSRGVKSASLMGDEAKLEKLLINIVRNGIKYTESGGWVRIRTENGGGKVTIRVEDSGIGIPEEDLPYIFERFYRVDKARSRAEGGSGLGLSIVKWIIDAHSGRIDVKSREGKGSQFIISLPVDYKKYKLTESML